MPNELMKTLTVGANTYDLPQKTSDLTNDSGFITSETDPTVPSWAKASSKPTYTASEVGALPDTTAIPTNTSDLTNDSGFITGMTILSYGSSTWADFEAAYNANKVVYCRASSNADPASGSQTRLAFMAYVNNATTPTNVEFQYYRSISSHTASQQGDQVFVYKLDKTSGWSVTTREASVKVVAGDGLGGTYSNGTMTLTGPTKTSDLTNDSGFITTLNVESPITYTNNIIGFDGYDVTTTTTTLCNETVTTNDQHNPINGDLVYSDIIDADPIKVTFNGVEYICPRIDDSGYYYYGAEPGNVFDFSEYPFALRSGGYSGYNMLITKAVGTYTVKIETITDNITVSSDFAKARGYSIVENPSQVLVNESTTTTAESGSTIGYGTLSYFSESNEIIKVTFNNVEYICPRDISNYSYGAQHDYSSDNYDFSTYPFNLQPNSYDNNTNIITQTAGTYTVKIENLPTVAVLTNDFKKAIKSSFPGDVMIKGQDYVTAGQKSGSTLGAAATAEGYNTDASGESSHAEGSNTTASGNWSHAEGANTTASSSWSHAEGSITTASGMYSHAEGANTTASGTSSHAEGQYTTANHKSQHVFGEYNVLDPSTATANKRGNYVEIVGKGTSSSARSNARTLDWNGNEVLAGKLTVGTAPTANMDVTTKQYVDNATSNIPTKTSDLTNDSGFITSTTADNTYVPKTSTILGNTNSITYNSSQGSHSINLTTSGYGKAQLRLIANADGSSRVVMSAGSSTATDIITAGYSYTSSNTYTTISSSTTTINGVVTPTADGMAANKKYVDDSISAITASSIGAVAKAGDTITGNVVLNYGTGGTTGSPSITFSTDYGSTLKLAALEDYSYIQSDTLQLRADVQMLSGKTFTLASDPTANLQAATKQYVDNAITAAIGAAIGGSY